MSRDPSAVFVAGFSQHENGKLPEALMLYNEVLAVRPHWIPAILNKASVLYRLQRFAEAEAENTRALDCIAAEAGSSPSDGVPPSSPASLSFYEGLAHNNRGLARLKLGRFDDSFADFDRAVHVRPDGFEAALLNRGLAHYQKNRLENARLDFERAARLNPGSYSAHNNLGVVYYDFGRFDDALQQFQKAALIDPSTPPAHFNSGNTLVRKGLLEQAVEQYARANRCLEEQNPPLDMPEKISDLVRNKKISDASASNVKQALANPGSTHMHTVNTDGQPANPVDATNTTPLESAAAPAARDKGKEKKDADDDGGDAEAENSSPRKPNFAGLRNLTHGDPDSAIARLTEAMSKDPDASPSLLHYDLGVSKMEKGEFEEALREFTLALDFNPTFPDALIGRGYVLRRLKRPQEAILDYSTALVISPKHRSAAVNRGVVHREVGMRKNALEDFSLALTLDPTVGSTWFQRGQVYADLGMDKEAVDDFNKCLSLEPLNLDCLRARGFSFIELGDFVHAERDLSYYLKKNPIDTDAEERLFEARELLKLEESARRSKEASRPPPVAPSSKTKKKLQSVMVSRAVSNRLANSKHDGTSSPGSSPGSSSPAASTPASPAQAPAPAPAPAVH